MIILTASRTSDFIFDQMLGVDRILYKTTKFGSNLLEAMECPPHMVKTLDKAIGKVLSEENFSFTKFDYCSKCFARIKDLFNEEYQYFRNMNSEQFEELVNIYMEENENVIGSLSRSMFSPIRDSIKCLISIYGPNNINTYMNYMFKEIFDIARESDENEVRVIVTYSDYMIMCAHLLDIDDDFRKPKWKLKRVEDITQCHDEVSFICNMRTNEEEMKKYAKAFDAVKDNWNDMLYSEDEFSVVAPKTPMDIADEGIYLQHCVKSYLENVIAGKTNILFVRKSNDLEKPFYTLEVKNNRIRQCHGFANCNVSATNGLQEFLERYCKEKHIKLEDTDKVLAVG
jgi:hypothetical protein